MEGRAWEKKGDLFGQATTCVEEPIGDRTSFLGEKEKKGGKGYRERVSEKRKTKKPDWKGLKKCS